MAVQQWRNINLNPNRHSSYPPFAHSLLYLPLSSIPRISGIGDGASLSWRPARRSLSENFSCGIQFLASFALPLYAALVSRASVFRFNSPYAELLYSQTTLDSIRARVVPTR